MTYAPLLHDLQPDILHHGDERARRVAQLKARISFCARQIRFERQVIRMTANPCRAWQGRQWIMQMLAHGRKAREQLERLV